MTIWTTEDEDSMGTTTHAELSQEESLAVQRAMAIAKERLTAAGVNCTAQTLEQLYWKLLGQLRFHGIDGMFAWVVAAKIK